MNHIEIINLISKIKSDLDEISDYLNQNQIFKTSTTATATATATATTKISTSSIQPLKHSIIVSTNASTPTITNTSDLIKENEFDYLKNMLEKKEWPEAVFDFQMVNKKSEFDKEERAASIVNILIEEDLGGKKFLDFGCGEGHVCKYSSTKSKFSVGYDLISSNNSNLIWEVNDCNYLLTTSFDNVVKNGPYDVILLFDVLDHAKNPVDVLFKCKNLIREGGKIYLRCHPWTARHGGHLYDKINKAFVHLIFDEKELKKLGFENLEFNNKILYPIDTYEKFIKSAELKKYKEDVETQEPEPFFEKDKILSKRIRNAIPSGEFPSWQLSICFADYILTK